MAINLNGQYIVVEKATEQGVEIRVHADATHRDRYKAGTETEFETTKHEYILVAVDLSVMADATKSVKDNTTTAGYAALKTLEEFAEATYV